MKKIEKNINFQERMKQHGYSIDKYARFVKKSNDAKLTLSFGYTTKGTCYLNFFINYPKAEMIIKQIGDFQVPQIGGNTGYLLADKKFKELDVVVLDEKTKTPLILNDIIKSIEQFVFPILDRYSVIKSLLFDYENELLPKVLRIEERLLPVLYFVAGNKERSVDLLDSILEKYSTTNDSIITTSQEKNGAEIICIESVISSQYICFANEMKNHILNSSFD